VWLRRSYTSHNPGYSWQRQRYTNCETTATPLLHHIYPGYDDSPSYVTCDPSYHSYNLATPARMPATSTTSRVSPLLSQLLLWSPQRYASCNGSHFSHASYSGSCTSTILAGPLWLNAEAVLAHSQHTSSNPCEAQSV